MVAQAARRLNASKAAERLQRAKIAKRRKPERRKRGQVLEFPGGRSFGASGSVSPTGGELIQFPGGRSTNASQIRESDLYERGKSAKEEAAFIQQRIAKERAHKDMWAKHKLQSKNMLQNYLRPPTEYLALSEEEQQEEEIQEAYEEYSESVKRISEQTRQLNYASARSKMDARRASQARKKLAQRIKQRQESIKKAKEAKNLAFTTYEWLGEFEDEGAALWSVTGSGNLSSMYRSIKSIILPGAAISKDPDAGQFLKGYLSFMEPTALNIRNIESWASGLHAIWAWFITLIIVTATLFVMMFAGTVFLALMNAADNIETYITPFA